MSSALLVANIVALFAAALCLAWLLLPLDQAIRVRNAFLLRRGRREDFVWTPAEMPADFRAEHADAPASIGNDVASAGIPGVAGDWPRACALVGMLVRHARHEGGIQADLVTTYRRIVAGQGYCADYVRVYMAAARRAGLFCRQWAFSFDGFGGHGHTFVEVYDRQRGAWAFIDVHNNVYAVVGASRVPADALSLHAALRDAPASVEFIQAGEGRLGFPVPGKLLAYYQRGAGHWYLWWGNDVVSRERRGVSGVIGRVSGRVAHRVGSAIGALPALVVLVAPENEVAIARMERLRRSVIAASALVAGLALALGIQLGWHWIERRPA
jgi:hypothetical protein